MTRMAGDPASAVLALIDADHDRSPFMVAVDGMSAAGKSTLASEVVELLPDAQLHRWDAAERHNTAHLRPADSADLVVSGGLGRDWREGAG